MRSEKQCESRHHQGRSQCEIALCSKLSFKSRPHWLKKITSWTSPALWTIKGDCLRRLQRFDEAHEAFAEAQAMDKDDLRAAAGLASCLMQNGDHAGALSQIARALAADVDGKYRQWLLGQQKRILDSITGWNNVEKEQLRKRDAAFMATFNG